MQERRYFQYWGKALDNEGSAPEYHLLPYHSLDVAAVGHELLYAHPSLLRSLQTLLGMDEETCRAWVVFFLALHDLGKFAEAFQNLRADLLRTLLSRTSQKVYPSAFHHDSMGFLLWYERLSDRLIDEDWLRIGPRIRMEREWPDVFKIWISAVTGHHGKPPKAGREQLVGAFGHFVEEDIEAALEFVRQVAALFVVNPSSLSLTPRELINNFRRGSWLLAGLAVLCDWIGSNVRFFDYRSDQNLLRWRTKPADLQQYWEKAKRMAQSALADAGVLPAEVGAAWGLNALFPKIRRYGIASPLQEHVERCSIPSTPQCFILEDVTGAGKTEAALVLAHRLMSVGLADGIFVALPTMATANQMYSRLAAAYNKLFIPGSEPSLVLAHSATWLHTAFRQSILDDPGKAERPYVRDDETATARCSAWIADNRKKAFLADIGVGTIDQVLMGVLPFKHQSLRLLGLSRKVLVVDEVHAYDNYMQALIERMLQFHAALGGSAILLSATLPATMRKALASAYCKGLPFPVPSLSSEAYPLVTHFAGADLPDREVAVGTRPEVTRHVEVSFVHEQDEILRILLEASQDGRCACWLRNTVSDAIDGYELLKPYLGDKLILFHARYALCDRLARENEVIATFGESSDPQHRAGKVLIATQVVEQSLDLDFDVMVSDLAPIDLLIQRAGRVKRHVRDSRGERKREIGAKDDRGTAKLYVYSPEISGDPPSDWFKAAFPKAAFVYPDHGQLWLTARLLEEKGGWVMPDDARIMIESVFGDLAAEIPVTLQAKHFEAEGKNAAQTSLAASNALNLTAGYCTTPQHWLDDVMAPTRLGEASTTVHLAKWDGCRLVPWSDDPELAWELSRLQVRQTLIDTEFVAYPDALRAAVDSVKEVLPDKGKWSVLVVLQSDGVRGWVGRAVDPNGEMRTVAYDQILGLVVRPAHG